MAMFVLEIVKLKSERTGVKISFLDIVLFVASFLFVC